MISRVAESCFWLHRHIERADAMARLLRVNRSFVLDAPLEERRKWYPLLVVSGEDERFDAQHPGQAADGDAVQAYLTWDRENPVSIISAVYWARENARTIREVISLEMWEVVNELWHTLSNGAGRRQFKRDPDAFYRNICDGAGMFHGICDNTMLHTTPYDFMQMGTLLERAGQTARVLDVHHHTFDAEETAGDEALARVQWLALLRSCSGTGPFLKRMGTAPTGARVVEFLILEPAFPRSVLYCLRGAHALLGRLRPDEGHAQASWAALSALRDSLEGLDGAAVTKRGVHEELTRLVEGVAGVCGALHDDFFDPAPLAGQTQRQHSSA